MTVRAATPEDAATLAVLAARTFHLACPRHTTPEAIAAHIAGELNPQRFVEHMAAGAQFYLIGDEAYLMLAFDPPPIDTDWQRPLEVKRIYVAADAHGSGLAKELMDVAFERAQAGGHDVVWLGTNKENIRALRFYAKCGFRIVGERTFYVGGVPEDDYVLAAPVGA